LLNTANRLVYKHMFAGNEFQTMRAVLQKHLHAITCDCTGHL